MPYLARKTNLRRRRMTVKVLKILRLGVIAFLLFQVGHFLIIFTHYINYTVILQSPVVIKKVEPTPTPTSVVLKKRTTESTPRGANHITDTSKKVSGIAGYYSRTGCLGCSQSLIMANGEKLTDSDLTIALNIDLVNTNKLLNDIVEVRNIDSNLTVKARVTDTGGFNQYGRIADLSVATRDAIKCSNLCRISVTF